MLFITSYFLRFTSRIEILGTLRFDFLLMAVIAGFMVIEAAKSKGALGGAVTKRLLILCGYIVLSTPFVKWPGSVIRFGFSDYLKVIFFFFFTVFFITNEKRLRIFLYIFLGCQLIRIMEPLFLNITTGYTGSTASYYKDGALYYLNRLAGAPHDVINGNQLAWIIVTTIPFLYFIFWKSGGKLRLISIGLIIANSYSFILTGSRSGFICLVITVFTVAFLENKRKIKTTVIALIILTPVMITLFALISPELSERYWSIIDPSAAGRETWQRRLESISNPSEYAAERVIFGHGLGTSAETNYNLYGGRVQSSHNLYIEITQELGIIGLIIFIMYIYSLMSLLNQTKKKFEKTITANDWIVNLIKAIQAWVIMDIIYSFSCFGLSSWEWYLFGGMAVVSVRILNRENFGIEKMPGKIRGNLI